MNPHEWYVENRAAFVARSLEPDEERTYRDHLAHCDECSAEVKRLEQDLAWLPMGVIPVGRARAPPKDGGRDPRPIRGVAAASLRAGGCRDCFAVGLGLRDRARGDEASFDARGQSDPDVGARGHGLRPPWRAAGHSDSDLDGRPTGWTADL